MSSLRAGLVVTSLLAGIAGCTSDPPMTGADAATDAPLGDRGPSNDQPADASDDVADASCAPLTPLATGSADGAMNPLTIPAGGVRAGRLRGADFPADRTGLALWKEGDFVLANERVALIVEALRPSGGYNPWGGGPVGVARVSNGRLVEAGDFFEPIFGLGRWVMATESVTVLRDGTDGTAVIRAIGPLRPLPFIDQFGRVIAPADYDGVRVAIDYTLRPGADHVDISAVYQLPDAEDRRVTLALNAFFQGYRMGRFFPGVGFIPTGGTTAAPSAQTVAWIDDQGSSWAWQLPEGQLRALLSISGFDLFSPPAFTLPGCAETTRPIARLVIGGRDVDGIVTALARIENTALRAVTGTVLDGAGAPVEGVHVHAEGAPSGPYLTRATTDAMGRFTVHVPMSDAVQLRAWRQGDGFTPTVNVAATGTTAALRFEPVGTLRVVTTETGTNTPLPVRVQVFPMGAAQMDPNETLGENPVGGGRAHAEFPVDGVASMRVRPGSYRVVISHGVEYERFDEVVTVTAGMTTERAVSLAHSVATPNVLCGDFHIHTHRSPDSDDSARFKAAAGIADGVEVLVRSEHEYVADFQPVIDALGAQRWARGVSSLELTTFQWGHFGVLPLTADNNRPNGGIFEWANRLAPAVFAEVRARPENPTLIVNHPRSPPTSFGYFDAAGYDRATGTATSPMMWDEQFNAVEVFNDSDFTANEAATVADWFSFLNRGRRVFAVGSSDSHKILEGQPVGYPRTCMYLGTDDPRMTTPEAIARAVREGRSTISGGVFIEAQAVNGMATAGPGQELTGVGNTARVSITAQAPSWVRVRQLRVFVDGVAMAPIALGDAQRDPMNPVIRYRGDVMVPVAMNGSHVVVVVDGEELDAVFPGRRAFGATNPIFLRR
ncbi:MAG: CehA/McbA family metallohydrolase [Polyangiales bacterium]